jgi:predicted metal-dependent hydrolase
MQIGDLEVEVIEKDIKNLHLAVYPPDGRVRLATPREVNPQTLELFVISKISWIRKQQRKFAEQNRQSPRQYVNRESHYFLGKKYLLRIHENHPKVRGTKVQVKTRSFIDLYTRGGASREMKALVLKEWYRDELRKVLNELVPKWEKILGVKTNEVFIKTMKTKWGSCNPKSGNILINLELAKKPIECIEYIVAHELTHLIERTHNSNFQAHLDFYLPNWKQVRDELNRLPVGDI